MNPNELLLDIAARTRRIETKLTRLVTGEGDKGVTGLDYELAKDNSGWLLKFNSASVTLFNIAKILEEERIPVGSFVDCYDNDRYMITVCREE